VNLDIGAEFIARGCINCCFLDDHFQDITLREGNIGVMVFHV
jgi:hypothetical protein